MAVKKSKQKKAVKQKPKIVERMTSHLGAIEKIVTPKEKEVRVKTFIVEKPVYISADRKFPARGYDAPVEPERTYDAKRSRYARRRDTELDNDSLEDKQSPLPEEDSEFKDDSELPEGEEPLEEGTEEIPEDDLGEEGDPGMENTPQSRTHTRAGLSSILSVWWKRALVFAILWWLAVLAFILVLQTFNLVTVDINRGWWVFLGIIVALSIVYQKFLSGKI